MMYTTRELITALQHLATQLDRAPTRREMDAYEAGPDSGTYYRRFGSWPDALERAGIAHEQRHSYTNDELLATLRTLARDRESGQPPTMTELRAADDLPSPETYQSRFGSWNTALYKAGFTPRSSTPYTREQLLAAVDELATAVGGVPTAAQMDEQGAYAASTLMRAFGSWNQALRAAGYEPTHPTYTDTELIEALSNLASELGQTPTIPDVEKRENLPSAQTFSTRFGSWTAALRAANLEPLSHEYTSAALLAHLRTLADDLGKTPTIRELTACDECPGATVYKDRFGSWNDALRAAGFEPVKQARYSDDELLSYLHELTATLDRVPTMREMAAADWTPSSSLYRQRFGSWSNALEEAGLH